MVQTAGSACSAYAGIGTQESAMLMASRMLNSFFIFFIRIFSLQTEFSGIPLGIRFHLAYFHS